MFAQFQARYPTGSLNSELLTIYQGKFIVRVSVQVEGVTRATGMAAAETLEIAEDRARSRALMILGIQSETRLPPHSSLDAATEVQTQQGETVFASALPTQQTQIPSAIVAGSDNRNYGFSPDTPLIEAATPAPAALELPEHSRLGSALPSGHSSSPVWAQHSAAATPAPAALELLDERSLTATPSGAAASGAAPSAVGNLELLADAETSEETSVAPLSKATSLFSPNYEPEEDADVAGLGAKTGVAVDQPIDLSAAIARTTVELKRLGWTNKQGRDYLERTYGVRSRQQLDNEQMLEFLHYLESQPSPSKG